MVGERAYDAFGLLRGYQYGSTFGPDATGRYSATAAWGQVALGPDPAGFGGQWGYQGMAGTGAVSLLGHRLYDASTGRFLNRDPIGYAGGLNLYGFAGNNPVNRIDPEGTDDDPGYQYLGDVFRGWDEQVHAFQRTLKKSGDAYWRTYNQVVDAGMMQTQDMGLPRGELVPPGTIVEPLKEILRQKAGFGPKGTPIIVDTSIGANTVQTAAALRAEGYNARSVSEVFGPKDPRDPAIRQLARQIGGRVLTSETKTNALEGFGETALKIPQSLRTAAQVVSVIVRLVPK